MIRFLFKEMEKNEKETYNGQYVIMKKMNPVRCEI